MPRARHLSHFPTRGSDFSGAFVGGNKGTWQIHIWTRAVRQRRREIVLRATISTLCKQLPGQLVTLSPHWFLGHGTDSSGGVSQLMQGTRRPCSRGGESKRLFVQMDGFDGHVSNPESTEFRFMFLIRVPCPDSSTLAPSRRHDGEKMCLAKLVRKEVSNATRWRRQRES